MTDLRRLYYISDPSSIATNLLPDPVRESDLRSWIDTVADAGVSTFCQEVFSQGWTTSAPNTPITSTINAGSTVVSCRSSTVASLRSTSSSTRRTHEAWVSRRFPHQRRPRLPGAPAGPGHRPLHRRQPAIPAHRVPRGRVLPTRRAVGLHPPGSPRLYHAYHCRGRAPFRRRRHRAVLPRPRLLPTRSGGGSSASDDRHAASDACHSKRGFRWPAPDLGRARVLDDRGMSTAGTRRGRLDRRGPDRPRQPAGRDVRRPAAAAISPGASTRNLANRSTALRVPSMFRCAAFAATPAWTSSPYASTPPAHVNSAAYTGVSRATRTTSAIGATNSTDLKDYSVA